MTCRNLLSISLSILLIWSLIDEEVIGDLADRKVRNIFFLVAEEILDIFPWSAPTGWDDWIHGCSEYNGTSIAVNRIIQSRIPRVREINIEATDTNSDEEVLHEHLWHFLGATVSILFIVFTILLYGFRSQIFSSRHDENKDDASKTQTLSATNACAPVGSLSNCIPQALDQIVCSTSLSSKCLDSNDHRCSGELEDEALMKLTEASTDPIRAEALHQEKIKGLTTPVKHTVPQSKHGDEVDDGTNADSPESPYRMKHWVGYQPPSCLRRSPKSSKPTSNEALSQLSSRAFEQLPFARRANDKRSFGQHTNAPTWEVQYGTRNTNNDNNLKYLEQLSNKWSFTGRPRGAQTLKGLKDLSLSVKVPDMGYNAEGPFQSGVEYVNRHSEWSRGINGIETPVAECLKTYGEWSTGFSEDARQIPQHGEELFLPENTSYKSNTAWSVNELPDYSTYSEGHVHGISFQGQNPSQLYQSRLGQDSCAAFQHATFSNASNAMPPERAFQGSNTYNPLDAFVNNSGLAKGSPRENDWSQNPSANNRMNGNLAYMKRVVASTHGGPNYFAPSMISNPQNNNFRRGFDKIPTYLLHRESPLTQNKAYGDDWTSSQNCRADDRFRGPVPELKAFPLVTTSTGLSPSFDTTVCYSGSVMGTKAYNPLDAFYNTSTEQTLQNKNCQTSYAYGNIDGSYGNQRQEWGQQFNHKNLNEYQSFGFGMGMPFTAGGNLNPLGHGPQQLQHAHPFPPPLHLPPAPPPLPSDLRTPWNSDGTNDKIWSYRQTLRAIDAWAMPKHIPAEGLASQTQYNREKENRNRDLTINPSFEDLERERDEEFVLMHEIFDISVNGYADEDKHVLQIESWQSLDLNRSQGDDYYSVSYCDTTCVLQTTTSDFEIPTNTSSAAYEESEILIEAYDEVAESAKANYPLKEQSSLCVERMVQKKKKSMIPFDTVSDGENVRKEEGYLVSSTIGLKKHGSNDGELRVDENKAALVEGDTSDMRSYSMFEISQNFDEDLYQESWMTWSLLDLNMYARELAEVESDSVKDASSTVTFFSTGKTKSIGKRIHQEELKSSLEDLSTCTRVLAEVESEEANGLCKSESLPSNKQIDGYKITLHETTSKKRSLHDLRKFKGEIEKVLSDEVKDAPMTQNGSLIMSSQSYADDINPFAWKTRSLQDLRKYKREVEMLLSDEVKDVPMTHSSSLIMPSQSYAEDSFQFSWTTRSLQDLRKYKREVEMLFSDEVKDVPMTHGSSLIVPSRSYAEDSFQFAWKTRSLQDLRKYKREVEKLLNNDINESTLGANSGMSRDSRLIRVGEISDNLDAYDRDSKGLFKAKKKYFKDHTTDHLDTSPVEVAKVRDNDEIVLHMWRATELEKDKVGSYEQSPSCGSNFPNDEESAPLMNAVPKQGNDKKFHGPSVNVMGEVFKVEELAVSAEGIHEYQCHNSERETNTSDRLPLILIDPLDVNEVSQTNSEEANTNKSGLSEEKGSCQEPSTLVTKDVDALGPVASSAANHADISADDLNFQSICHQSQTICGSPDLLVADCISLDTINEVRIDTVDVNDNTTTEKCVLALSSLGIHNDGCPLMDANEEYVTVGENDCLGGTPTSNESSTDVFEILTGCMEVTKYVEGVEEENGERLDDTTGIISTSFKSKDNEVETSSDHSELLPDLGNSKALVSDPFTKSVDEGSNSYSKEKDSSKLSYSPFIGCDKILSYHSENGIKDNSKEMDSIASNSSMRSDGNTQALSVLSQSGTANSNSPSLGADDVSELQANVANYHITRGCRHKPASIASGKEKVEDSDKNIWQDKRTDRDAMKEYSCCSQTGERRGVDDISLFLDKTMPTESKRDTRKANKEETTCGGRNLPRGCIISHSCTTFANPQQYRESSPIIIDEDLPDIVTISFKGNNIWQKEEQGTGTFCSRKKGKNNDLRNKYRAGQSTEMNSSASCQTTQHQSNLQNRTLLVDVRVDILNVLKKRIDAVGILSMIPK